MKKFPIKIPNSVINFALRGNINGGFELLVISENCPIALHNAMPSNSAGKTSGRLAHTWFNSLDRNYNWAYSDYLPEIDRPADFFSSDQRESITDSNHEAILSFQLESRLQFAWRGYSTKSLRLRVQKQLDRQKLDLCKAILANNEVSTANALAPIILECEGYSI